MTVPWQGCLLGLLIALGSDTLAKANEAAKPPVFSVRTASGARVRGVWRELKADWSARLGEGDGTLVAGDDVLTLRRTDQSLPPMPVDEHLILANGDRIPYRDKTLRLVGEKIHLRHTNLAAGSETSLPLAAVAVLWRTAPDKTLDAEKLRRRLAAGARTRDTVCLRNGDILAGTLIELDEKKVAIEIEKKRVTVRIEQVAYLGFNTELADTLRSTGVYARLVLADTRPGRGGRISLTSATSTDGVTLNGVTVFGARLSVPTREIAALDLYRGRADYISDLKSSKYETFPYLDATWPFAIDSNVAEHDLLLHGSTYDKGISLHSRARLTYRLDGAYRHFEALVGLDDKDGRGGSVRIRVLADGKPLDLAGDRELTVESGPLPIRVKVEGVRALTLEVDFGRGGDVCDVVDWVDARLVK